MDFILETLLFTSVIINICFYKRLKNLEEQLSECRRFHMKYKTQLGIPDRDYEDNEECYKGIAGGDR